MGKMTLVTCIKKQHSGRNYSYSVNSCNNPGKMTWNQYLNYKANRYISVLTQFIIILHTRGTESEIMELSPHTD